MTMLKPVTVAMPVGADREVERLRLKVADLQAENAGLRRRLPESTGDMKRLRQAYRDAKAMLLHRFDGYSISCRDNCLAVGITNAVGAIRGPCCNLPGFMTAWTSPRLTLTPQANDSAGSDIQEHGSSR